jgi:hypothetical protein
MSSRRLLDGEGRIDRGSIESRGVVVVREQDYFEDAA